MSKVITFSRTYPRYHPRAGQPTYFVEMVWNSIAYMPEIYLEQFAIPYKQLGIDFVNTEDQKHHTIRAGHRFKAGEWFRPVVWGDDINPRSGRSGPYQSKQITFAPDIQVKKTWDFEMDINGVCAIAKPNEPVIYTFEYDELYLESSLDNEIAKNDGLSSEDLYWWFSRSPDFKKKDGFDGQIICWNENINY